MDNDKLEELLEEKRVLKHKMKMKNMSLDKENKVNKDIKLLKRIFQIFSLSTLLLFFTNVNPIIIILIYVVSNAPYIYTTYSESLSSRKLRVINTDLKVLKTKLLLNEHKINKLQEIKEPYIDIEKEANNKQRVLIKK